MAAKEWWDARWKLFIAAVGAVLAALIVAAYLPPYETTERVVERFPAKAALAQILNVYEGGGVALALLAILLGAAAVSEEVSRGTIFLLLSRPAGRTRVLLTKYAVSAGILLLAAALGHAMLVTAAVLRGYPLGLLNVYGVVLSTVLIWVGSLSVLGLSLTFSVLSRNTLVSMTATLVAVFLAFYAPQLYFAGLLVRYGVLERVAPLLSWTSVALYAGEGLALLNFFACTVAAVGLLVLPLWLFRRRAY